jgi:hypothetical protein
MKLVWDNIFGMDSSTIVEYVLSLLSCVCTYIVSVQIGMILHE